MIKRHDHHHKPSGNIYAVYSFEIHVILIQQSEIL
jgi:hypothetical protein